MYIYNVHMKKQREVSISDARERLPSLVRDAERGLATTLTRRGEPVAVLISTEQFRASAKSDVPLPEAIEAFRRSVDLDELNIEDVYRDVRDASQGRDVEL